MQLSLFGGMTPFKIDKPIRLIELFAGYGSQHFALKYLGTNFESWKTCEWAVKSIQAYKDAHFEYDTNDYSSRLDCKQIIDYLYNKGISQNYNEPMKYESIKRLGEDKVRTIYNNIIATHNLVNIQQVKGKDLEIVDIDNYCYIMTYSFPCQDLSVAGLGKGMAKDSGTRSGMLWEVERILDEIVTEGGHLPQVLLMENVPQVHGTKNREHFDTWVEKLSELGYSNFWQDLNAKDFGVPQNRKRCFMVSILGNLGYEFPKPKVLDKKLKDLLDDNVDESFYLSNSKLNSISQWKAHQDPLKDIDKDREICPCLTARGAGEEHSGMVLINEDVYNLKKQLCNKLIDENLVQEGDVIRHSYSNNRLKNGEKNMGRIESKEKLSPTLDTRCDCLGVVVNDVSPLQKEVCNKAIESDVVEPTDMFDYTYSNSRLKEIENGEIKTKNSEDNTISCTLTTNCDNLGVCVYGEKEMQLFTEDGNIKRYIDSYIIDKFEEGQMATTTFPNGYGHGPRTHNESIALNTVDRPSVKNNYRIRKLTPKECFRLMGVKDQDFEKIAKNQSNQSLYHLAGDSIVVDVLMSIFKEML